MGTFEYLSVFVSIILGLGITYGIVGVGQLVRKRNQYEFYWLHTIQIFATFLILLNAWWITYSWVGMTDLSFFHYLFLTCAPFVIVLASTFLFPGREESDKWSLKDHYFSVSRPYYILISLVWPLDFIDTLLKGTDRVAELGWTYSVISWAAFPIIASVAFTRKPWYHGLVQIINIIGLIVTKFMYAPTLESLI